MATISQEKIDNFHRLLRECRPIFIAYMLSRVSDICEQWKDRIKNGKKINSRVVISLNDTDLAKFEVPNAVGTSFKTTLIDAWTYGPLVAPNSNDRIVNFWPIMTPFQEAQLDVRKRFGRDYLLLNMSNRSLGRKMIFVVSYLDYDPSIEVDQMRDLGHNQNRMPRWKKNGELGFPVARRCDPSELNPAIQTYSMNGARPSSAASGSSTPMTPPVARPPSVMSQTRSEVDVQSEISSHSLAEMPISTPTGSSSSVSPIIEMKPSEESGMDTIIRVAQNTMSQLIEKNEIVKAENGVDVLSTLHTMTTMVRTPENEEYIRSVMNALSMAHYHLSKQFETNN